MLKKELKDLIYDLENILKLDKRFKNNGENKYKKMIKKMFINSNKQSLFNLTYLSVPKPPEIIKIPMIQNYQPIHDDYEFLVKIDNSLDELNKIAKSSIVE